MSNSKQNWYNIYRKSSKIETNPIKEEAIEWVNYNIQQKLKNLKPIDRSHDKVYNALLTLKNEIPKYKAYYNKEGYEINSVDYKRILPIYERIQKAEYECFMPKQLRITTTPSDMAKEEIQQGFLEDAKLQQLKTKIKNCKGFKILEVDQFSASDPKFNDISIPEFNEDDLESDQAQAAKQMFGGKFNLKWVCPTDNPPIGTVWFRQNHQGKLFKYKENYDTSD